MKKSPDFIAAHSIIFAKNPQIFHEILILPHFHHFSGSVYHIPLNLTSEILLFLQKKLRYCGLKKIPDFAEDNME